MITARGTRGEKNAAAHSHAEEDDNQVRLDVDEQGKPFEEAPRMNVAPKDEISVNITIGLTVLLFLLFMALSVLYNMSNYSGFYFGRLT